MDLTLSISLLASDHRESLERCLDSLKPLLAKVPSELIIVFTGTNQNVKKIAEKYTPHVIPFQWCGDFSAARNVGLKEACGEWFLYLDDDEWFDDTDEICEFFLSGEYRQYHSAHYIQRNYLDWGGTKYSDFSAFRMVKMLAETRFQNPIHEELAPRKEPCKYFQSCVHHYGYIKEAGTRNARNRNGGKISRNIPLLLQSVHKHPSFVKNYLQLAKEYDLEGDWRTAEEYCRKGRSICQKSEDFHSKGWLQAYLSYLLCEKPGKQQAISEIEEMIEQEHPSELILLILYQQLIHLYRENLEPERVVETGLKFERLLEEMDSKGFLWEQQAYGEFNESYVKNPGRLYSGRTDCIACSLELWNRETAAYFLQLLPWDEKSVLCRYYPDFEDWRAVYGSFFTSVLLRNFYTLNIADSSKGSAPLYIRMVKALMSLESGRKNEVEELYIQCIEHADDSYLQQVLLREALQNQMDVSQLASQMNLEAWDVCVAEAVSGIPYKLIDVVLESAEKLHKNYPFHGLCLKKWTLGQKLLKGFLLWDKLTAVLERYCQCILDFYRLQYREEMFADESHSLLPDECRFAMNALKLLELMAQEQTTGIVQYIRKCTQMYPPMTGVMNELLRQVGRRINDPALHAVEEFRQLAGQMKETLNILMDAGQTSQASEILNQLLPLMPEDTELIRIRQELIRRTR